MSIKIYEYSGCSTCKKALKFLETNKIKFEKLPIVDNPPTKTEIKSMLAHLKASGGGLKNLFNTSGQVYRELKISEKLPSMSEAEAIELLSKNGKLIKRPFLITEKAGVVGFKEPEWKKILK